MRKPLLDRCQPESIREFRAAARGRYDDGLIAAGGGRGLAAVYLWGYAAEMTLKAAYFSAVGLGKSTHIQVRDHINPAINLGKARGIAWRRGGHDVRAWAELLVRERASHPTKAYTAEFGGAVQANGQRISQLWNETLRYHKNVPYPHEIRQIREAVEWLLVHSELL